MCSSLEKQHIGENIIIIVIVRFQKKGSWMYVQLNLVPTLSSVLSQFQPSGQVNNGQGTKKDTCCFPKFH